MNDVGARDSAHLHPWIAELQQVPESESAFWDKVAAQTTPLLEPDSASENHTFVTYIWHLSEEAHHVVVQPGGFADPPSNLMDRIPGTRTCFACYRYRNDVRLNYTFAIDMPLVSWDDATQEEIDNINKTFLGGSADPHNPNEIKLQFRSVSMLELDEAIDESLAYKRPNIARGQITETRFKSEHLKNERTIWVYTPPHYAEVTKPCKLLMVFDGGWYLSLIPTHRILDNLLDDEAIDPVIAVFIDNATPTSRNTELACDGAFLSFIDEELLPWVKTNYRISESPEDAYVAGSSLGGLAAVWLGYRLPQLFGNVIGQAAALGKLTLPEQPPEPGAELIKQFQTSSQLPLRFWLEVGLLDNDKNIISANRRMKNVLQAKNYDLTYHEFAGGHDFMLWRGTLAQAIMTMMGKPKRL
ncbi:MAG: alpha/beta hydrolase-fold protein [Pseudomonadota bacterium]